MPVRSWVDTHAGEMLAAAPSPQRALFLDRDGVINIDAGYVHSPAQVEWVPGIFELCAAARNAGLLIVVATNQAGIARGLYDEPQFLRFTQWMHAQFHAHCAPLLATYYCPHHPSYQDSPGLSPCSCRKPAPGMLLSAAVAFGIDLPGSMLLGDKASDLQAAAAAGVGRSILISGHRLPSFDALGVCNNAGAREPWLGAHP